MPVLPALADARNLLVVWLSGAYEQPDENEHTHYDGQHDARSRPFVTVFRKPAHLIPAHAVGIGSYGDKLK
jgi:hypothetical protein